MATPLRTSPGIVATSLAATSGSATVVLAMAVSAALLTSVAVSYCRPTVRNVAVKTARPSRSVTVAGNVASGSEEVSATVP